MDQQGQLAGESLLRGAHLGVSLVRGFETFDLFAWEKREQAQEHAHVRVVGVHEELIEAVARCALRIEPHGALRGLAKLGAVGLREQWEHQAPNGCAELLSRELGAHRDVAPLIGGPDLELAVIGLAEVVEVVALQQHVAELGEADASLPGFHP